LGGEEVAGPDVQSQREVRNVVGLGAVIFGSNTASAVTGLWNFGEYRSSVAMLINAAREPAVSMAAQHPAPFFEPVPISGCLRPDRLEESESIEIGRCRKHLEYTIRKADTGFQGQQKDGFVRSAGKSTFTTLDLDLDRGSRNDLPGAILIRAEHAIKYSAIRISPRNRTLACLSACVG